MVSEGGRVGESKEQGRTLLVDTVGFCCVHSPPAPINGSLVTVKILECLIDVCEAL